MDRGSAAGAEILKLVRTSIIYVLASKSVPPVLGGARDNVSEATLPSATLAY